MNGRRCRRHVIADRPAQDGELPLERVEHGALRHRAADLELHLVGDTRQVPQMRRKDDTDHGQASVCTSTETTGGRSWTMAFQVSPASLDAYTCPPVVPK